MRKFLLIISFAFLLNQISWAKEEYPPTLGSMAGFVLYENRIPLPPHPPMQAKNGKTFQLQDFKGTVTIINFWAPWCAPCRRELPSLSKLQKQYPKNKMQIVLLDVNHTNREEGDNMLKRNNNLKNLLNLYEGGKSLSQIIKIRALPTTYIIDKNSKIVGYLPGEAQWHGKDTKYLIDHLINE